MYSLNHSGTRFPDQLGQFTTPTGRKIEYFGFSDHQGGKLELLPSVPYFAALSREVYSTFPYLQGVMLTANSIFKRFRYSFKSDELYAVIITCLKGFQEPLTQIYVRSVQAVEAFAGNF